MKSMRLAVGLLAYLALASLLATLVPQGQEAAFYQGAYPRLLALLLVQSGFTRFFTSLPFLLPVFLFFSNLSICAVDRFIRELKKKGKRRHGPDLLHLGLMLLVIGSVLSFSGRQEGSMTLAVGQGVQLPDGRVMRLTDFQFLQYADGRPKDWISTVDVTRGERVEVAAYPIRVNHPLKLGGLSIYQVSHSARSVLSLVDASGKGLDLGQGEERTFAGGSLFYMATEAGGGKAVIRLADLAGSAKVFRAAVGEAVGPYKVAALRDLDLTGLEAVKDPGYALVLAALVLTALGIFLTFIQKLGDMNP
jgi:hypothetical protein